MRNRMMKAAADEMIWMTKQEIKEVLDNRPDLVQFLKLALDNPELIPSVIKLLKKGEGEEDA